VKQKKTIYIPIEWKNRELDSSILLTKYAIENNFRVIVGSKIAIFYFLKNKKTKSGIFFYKGGLDLKGCEFVNKKCDAFVVLDQEIGPVTNTSFEYKIPTRFFRKTLKFIDRYYCIGEKLLKISKKLLEKKGKQFCVLSGWPRVDLWGDKAKNFYKLEEKLIRKKYKKYILFSSNFMCLDLNEIPIIKSKMRYWSEYKHPINVHIGNAKNSYKEFLGFKKFLKKYENLKKENLPPLIIRPHPNENINIWKEELKNYKNIFLENKYEISPWINSCEILLHRGCTSSAHAQVRNKKTVMVKSIKKNTLPKVNISKKISDFIIKDPSELNIILNKNKKPNTYLKDKGFIYFDNKMSSEIIVNDLIKINNINTDNFIKLSLLSKIYFYLREKLSFILQNKSNLNKNVKLENGIKKSYIKKKLKLINTKNLVIKEILNNLILIE